MRLVIVVVAVVAALAVAAVVVVRLQHRATIERTVGQDLQPGMPLAEVAAHLRALKVEFTVDSTGDGTVIVRFGREVTRNRRGTQVAEQQIVFDAQERLREMRSVAEIRGR